MSNLGVSLQMHQTMSAFLSHSGLKVKFACEKHVCRDRQGGSSRQVGVAWGKSCVARRCRDEFALLYLSFMRLARAAAIWSSDSSSMWTVLTCFMMSTA